jgi:hypothetical protein
MRDIIGVDDVDQQDSSTFQAAAGAVAAGTSRTTTPASPGPR